MKTIAYGTLVVAFLTLLGCGSLVQDVDQGTLPVATPKLVIHCFISPQDDEIVVYVQRLSTQSDTSRLPTNRSLEGCTVTLSDGTRTGQLYLYNNQFGTYYGYSVLDLPIVAGRTYTLTVSAANFPITTAYCTVPEQVKPTELRIDSLVRLQSDVPKTIYAGRLIWQDPVDQTNFYKVSGQAIETFTYSERQEPNGPVRDVTLTSNNDLLFDAPTLITDLSWNGKQLSAARGEVTFYQQSSLRHRGLQLNMTLSNVDENYYRYHHAVARQNEAENNPFAEPVLIPSNIQNGLGCFGAYNQSSLMVRVR
ncbi:DUF4249 domain-containing protein [uncultured Fibrella sp.]|uniref:DUF4249 domain-containing protein n=1 Tax=uncultured Fibrella sp. TaxID=1284596 RepID=UPI0035CC0B6B